jgi:hypothetical protein
MHYGTDRQNTTICAHGDLTRFMLNQLPEFYARLGLDRAQVISIAPYDHLFQVAARTPEFIQLILACVG